jgi:hypothetical protein
VRQAQQRSPSYKLSSSTTSKVQGWPAIELRGTQELLGRQVQTRSVHVFRAGEYVFEAIAPAKDFTLANDRVLEPLLHSLRFRPLPPDQS